MQLRDRTAGFVRTEGGLLPPDLLERIRALAGQLPSLEPASYGLERGDRFGEAITRSWNRLVGAWATFSDELAALPESDPATSPTRERWLLPLFEELGYGRLSPARAVEIDGKSYPVSHARDTIPLHLVGANVPLDRRSRGVAGAATQSPHGLLQEFLNRTSDRLWGIVSNGRTLRLLRDNASLTRQAYVEFDLEAIFSAEAYADFALLWHLAHRTRLEARHAEGAEEDATPTAHGAILERWSKIAADTGARARDRLRDGVQEAIEMLGSGFLGHPANGDLRTALQAGKLDTQDYYRQLLRLVYRLILLFVAEDRDLLLDPKADAATRDRYIRYYSTARLRRLAGRRKGSRHADLYAGLKVVITALGRDERAPGIGLPPLGGFLFGPDACPHLDAAELANVDLLDAIRKLATIEERGVLRAVDYRNLGSEELGSIYESLLELHPELDVNAGSFALRTAAGHERKTTGSYYTPSSLISVLLDSALDPVLAEAADKPTRDEAERAILELSVVDPAAGSGHFLVAAAHRIAKRLASVRSGDQEPAPEAIRTALRDVIGHCLYAVDINPMAVELCKVSLWLEALEPGKPLTFLDAHIKCGNSLLGTTPELVAQGIPDAAYTPIEGDDKKVAAALKKQNRAERGGQLSFGELTLRDDESALAGALRDVRELPDDSVEAVVEKQARYAATTHSGSYRRLKVAGDAWCAAFFTAKTPTTGAITTSTVRALASGNASGVTALDRPLTAEAERLGFFHWPIEFAELFANPSRPQKGFDVVLGNPPWDTLSPDAKEFFAPHDPGVRNSTPSLQRQIIERLLEDPDLANAWSRYTRDLYCTANFLRNAGRYTLYAEGNLGKGDFNTYRVFVELAMRSARTGGWASQVAPDGLLVGANASAIRAHLFSRTRLAAIYSFENERESWFKGVASRARFCIYAALVGGQTDTFKASFGIKDPAHLALAVENAIDYPLTLVRELAPVTLAISELSDSTTSDILAGAYSRYGAFGSAAPLRHYMAEVHMGNDRSLFEDNGLPVYEGRMIDQYDHRAKGYVVGRGRSAVWDSYEFGSPEKSIQPQWRIPLDKVPRKARERIRHYRIGFGDVTGPTNERSLVAALIPPNVICGHKVPTITFPDAGPESYMVWLSLANSFVVDFLVRRRVALSMTYSLLDALPVTADPGVVPCARELVELAARLTCTSEDMLPYWQELEAVKWVPRASGLPGLVDDSERRKARARIDAIVAARVYRLSRQTLSLVMDDFGTLARREQREQAEYLSKRLVLDAFDQVASETAAD